MVFILANKAYNNKWLQNCACTICAWTVDMYFPYFYLAASTLEIWTSWVSHKSEYNTFLVLKNRAIQVRNEATWYAHGMIILLLSRIKWPNFLKIWEQIETKTGPGSNNKQMWFRYLKLKFVFIKTVHSKVVKRVTFPSFCQRHSPPMFSMRHLSSAFPPGLTSV